VRRRFRERHLHFAPVSQRGKVFVRLRFAGHLKIERDPLETGFPPAAAVGRHHRGVADLHGSMADLVFRAGGEHSRRWRLRRFVVPHQHDELRSERFFVEGDRFVAAAVEVEVRVDEHDRIPFM